MLHATRTRHAHLHNLGKDFRCYGMHMLVVAWLPS